MNHDSQLEARWQALQAKLDSHRAALSRRGRLYTKRVGTCSYIVLRFGDEEQGRKVLRTIHIGRAADVELIQRVRCYLEECRLLARLPEELAAMAALAGALRGSSRSLDRQRRRGFRGAGRGENRTTSG